MTDQKMTPRRAGWLAAALCLLAAGATAAQPAPQFTLETIEIEGLTRPAAEGIVLAESRLQPGKTYTEVQLAEAVYRVRRLPFVLDAQFALKKGSERGAYILVITVESTRPVFYEASVAGFLDPDEDFHHDSAISLGARQFVGRHGLVFGNVLQGEGADQVPIQLGFTRYDLFGTGSFVTVIASEVVGADQGDSHGLDAEIGVPIDLRSSVRGRLSWSETDSDQSGFGGDPNSRIDRHAELSSVSLSWVYDTTDDPFFPVRGTLGRIGAGVGRSKSGGSTVFLDQRFEDDTDQVQWRVAASGARYYRISPRRSVSVGGGASWNRSELDVEPPPPAQGFRLESESFTVQADASYAYDFLPTARPMAWGDLRWETRASAGFIDLNETLGGTTASIGLSSSLVYRHAWGITRLTLSYSEVL